MNVVVGLFQDLLIMVKKTFTNMSFPVLFSSPSSGSLVIDWCGKPVISGSRFVFRMAEKRGRDVVSKQWSCSEVVEGHEGLVGMKKEKDSPRSLERKIQVGDVFERWNVAAIYFKFSGACTLVV